jgi:hypothetical protein
MVKPEVTDGSDVVANRLMAEGLGVSATATMEEEVVRQRKNR